MGDQQQVVSFVAKISAEIYLPPTAQQVALINRFAAARLATPRSERLKPFGLEQLKPWRR